jgi:hypothetical protein
MTAEIESGTGYVVVSFSTSTVASSKEAYSVSVTLAIPPGDDPVMIGYGALHLSQKLREQARITAEGAAAAAAVEEGTK